MSRLSPVTTGQPTQGLGAVPNNHKHASPLLAQRAEAEESGALALDDLAAPSGGLATPATGAACAVRAPSPSPINPRDPYSATRAAATAAWLSLSATELEVRNYFHKITVPSGLEALAKMRHQCNLAAETLQQRMDEGNQERCTGCGKTLEEARKSQFIMTGAEVDPETGVPMPYRYCGVQCVRERNREKMLPPEERGKLRFDGREQGEVL
jgi:hypothetical protein